MISMTPIVRFRFILYFYYYYRCRILSHSFMSLICLSTLISLNGKCMLMFGIWIGFECVFFFLFLWYDLSFYQLNGIYGTARNGNGKVMTKKQPYIMFRSMGKSPLFRATLIHIHTNKRIALTHAQHQLQCTHKFLYKILFYNENYFQTARKRWIKAHFQLFTSPYAHQYYLNVTKHFINIFLAKFVFAV